MDVNATVCLREGLLELVACTQGSKEHESIVSIAGRPIHIHTALLLFGARPGRRHCAWRETRRFVGFP